jgi:hypothetical protein
MIYVAAKRLHPKILMAWKHVQERIDPLSLCDHIFSLSTYSIDEHRGKKCDEIYLFYQRSGVFYILLPNQFEQL